LLRNQHALAVRAHGGVEVRLARFLNNVQKSVVKNNLPQERSERFSKMPELRALLKRWEDAKAQKKSN